MKKFIALCILGAILITTGCGASGESFATDTVYPIYQNQNTDAYTNTESANDQEFDGSYVSSSPLSSGITANKKIIRNAGIDIEAKDVQDTYIQLLDYAKSKGGYEFSQYTSSNSSYISINATIKLPPEVLDEVIAYASQTGKVINTRISSDDITSEYTDTQIRLETKKKALQKYYDLLENSETVEEILAIQQTIDSLTAEIESYEGQLRLWNSMTDESTLDIYIQQSDDPNKISEDIEWNSLSIESMGKLIKNGFKTVVNGIFSCLQWLIIIIATISPLLIIAAVIVIIILVLCKRSKKKKTPKPTNPKENKPE